MADKSKIEWCDSTWGPVTGCSKVSHGCKYCYAEREWPRLSAPRKNPNIYTGRQFTDVRCHPGRLDHPLRWRKPRRIFVNSMSDLFHEDVPFNFIDDVFDVMERCPQHVFQILTKRPERMYEWADSTGNRIEQIGKCPNVWLGVSVEDQETADERIPLLLQTPAAVRWLSVEPLLGSVDLTMALEQFHSHDPLMNRNPSPVQWVVVGGESGPKARPMHPAWARSLRDQCQAAGVSFLFKQWGEWVTGEIHTSDEYVGGAYVDAHGKTSIDAHCVHKFDSRYAAVRVGKRHTGRELDGRIWDEYPDG